MGRGRRCHSLTWCARTRRCCGVDLGRDHARIRPLLHHHDLLARLRDDEARVVPIEDAVLRHDLRGRDGNRRPHLRRPLGQGGPAQAAPAGRRALGAVGVPAVLALRHRQPGPHSARLRGGDGDLRDALRPDGAFLPELYGTRLRYSGASVSYNLGGVLGGAVAPIIATQLLVSTGASWSISLYILAM